MANFDSDPKDKEFELKKSQFRWEKFKAIVSALGLIATFGAVVGLAINYNISKQEQALNEKRRITETYAQSIEQLGHESVWVRVGGIYALEKIAQDARMEYSWTVMEVLTAYLRERSSKEDQKITTIPTDIQSALTVIGRRNVKQDPHGKRLDLKRTNLRGSDLSPPSPVSGELRVIDPSDRNTFPDANRADLSRADLRGSDLSYSNFSKVNFYGSDLTQVLLINADLREVKLAHADLDQANLSGAILCGAILEEADFNRANLSKANLSGANLHHVDLYQAQLNNANLKSTNLSNADLRGASLTNADLSKLRIFLFNRVSDAERSNNCPLGQAGQGANLQGADLKDADLTGANLEGANLRQVQNLSIEQIKAARNWEQAIYDAEFRRKLGLPPV